MPDPKWEALAKEWLGRYQGFGKNPEMLESLADLLERVAGEAKKGSEHPEWCSTALAQLASAQKEIERLKNACSKMNAEVCDTLGRALGYPYLKDDQENFPGAVEADGVCVGEHVAETLADEAAARIEKAEAAVEQAREEGFRVSNNEWQTAVGFATSTMTRKQVITAVREEGRREQREKLIEYTLQVLEAEFNDWPGPEFTAAQVRVALRGAIDRLKTAYAIWGSKP